MAVERHQVRGELKVINININVNEYDGNFWDADDEGARARCKILNPKITVCYVNKN